MKYPYLEVTYRNGIPLAAYLYLPRRPGDHAARTERRDLGLLVDFSSDGQPLGIEITAPRHAALENINRILSELNQQALSPSALAPLLKAG